MFTFLLGMIVDLVTGATRTRMAAVEAFGAPPKSRHALRLRTTALVLFLFGTALLFSASLVYVLAEKAKFF